MTGVNPSRLRLARKRRGLTLTALSKATGLSSRSLSAYENGETEPTPASRALIAGQLGFPESFFSDTDVEEIPVHAVSFRALSKMTARQRDIALSAGRIAALFDEWLMERFDMPSPDVPSLTGYQPDVAAETLRARWGLGERPIRNMIHLVEAHGVRVYSLPQDAANLDAFSLRWHGQPLILVDVRKSGERGRFDVAHELGHLVMHGEHKEVAGPDAEQEANAFAAAFLLPATSVRASSFVNPTVPTILDAKGHWDVSAMALVHRLHELAVISDWQYRSLCVDLARRGYRSSEPGGIPRETSQLLTKVLAQLRAEKVGLSTIAAHLRITPEDLRATLFQLTLASTG